MIPAIKLIDGILNAKKESSELLRIENKSEIGILKSTIRKIQDE